MQRREYSRAVLEFRNAAKAMPNDAEAYYQLGLALMGVQDYRLAYTAFKKGVSLNPKHTSAQVKIAQLQAATNDPALLQEATDRLKGLIDGNAATPELLSTLAMSQLKLGNTTGAIATLEQSLAQAPQELFPVMMLASAKLALKDVVGARAVLETAVQTSPKSADARRLLGEFFVSQKQPAEAEAAFRQALAINPQHAAALADLAVLQSQQGRKQEAEENVRRLSAIAGYEASHAIFVYQEGRRGEAIREFEKLAEANPENRQLRTNLVIAYRTSNRSADAEKVLTDVLKRNRKDAEALLQRAEIFIEAGKYGDAEADLNQLLKLRPNAPEGHYVMAKLNLARGMDLRYRQEISEALRLNPDLLPARVELAQNLIGANQAQAALDLLDRAPANQRSTLSLVAQRNWALWMTGNLPEMRKGVDAGLAVARTPDFLIQDGLWKLRSGNPVAARYSLEEALKLNPNDLRALNGLRDSYLAQKNAPLALQKMKEFATAHPNDLMVQEFFGNVLLGAGMKADARAAFQAAKAAAPTSTAPEMSLAQMDMIEGKLDDAGKRLQGILAENKSNTTARLWLANVEWMRGQVDPAIGHFREVVSADSGNAEAYNNLAYLLIDKQPDEALKYAQRAVELAPERSAYCDTLGWALYRKGLYSAAIQYLERAGKDKGDAVSKYHLAMAYAKTGDMARGRRIMDVALKQNPNLPEAKAAKELIGRAN